MADRRTDSRRRSEEDRSTESRTVHVIHWREHAVMYAIGANGTRRMMAGKLHALVDIALFSPECLDRRMIETDSGQMFCRREISYLGMLASRPGMD